MDDVQELIDSNGESELDEDEDEDDEDEGIRF